MLLSQPQEANVPPRQVFVPKCLLSSWSLLALPSPSSVVNLGVHLFSSLQLCGAPYLPSVSIDPAQDGNGYPGPFSGGNYNWEKLVGLGQTTELKQCWREPSGTFSSKEALQGEENRAEAGGFCDERDGKLMRNHHAFLIVWHFYP